MSTDQIEIEILQDGTIKTSTDKISAASHLNAENFLKEMARLAGGKVVKTAKDGHAHHEHEHGHGHGQHTHQ